MVYLFCYIILVGGGLFLLAKAKIEIHERLEGEEGHSSTLVLPSFTGIIIQIVLLDIVFSLDSVITAVGMAEDIAIMITAVILAVAVMMFAAAPISSFFNRRAMSADILHFPARVLVRQAAMMLKRAATLFPGRVLPIYSSHAIPRSAGSAPFVQARGGSVGLSVNAPWSCGPYG